MQLPRDPDHHLVACLMGAAYMMHLPPDYFSTEPSWLGNIEAALDGFEAASAKSYEDVLYMIEHWWAPAAECYMDDLQQRSARVTGRLVRVMTAHYDVASYTGDHHALTAARHAVRRLSGGQSESSRSV